MDRIDKFGSDAISGIPKADVVVDAKASLQDRIQTVRDAIQQTRIAATQSSEPVLALTRDNPLKALMIASMSSAFMWTLAKAFAFSRT